MKTKNTNKILSNVAKNSLSEIYHEKDKLWLVVWTLSISFLLLWNFLFLNQPTFRKLLEAFANTIFIGTFSILFTSIFGWFMGISFAFLKDRDMKFFYMMLTISLNVLRSIPQIIGILAGYIVLTFLLQKEMLNNPLLQMLFVGIVISIFLFPEFCDLIRERIEFFKQTEFYPAMRSCGIKEIRIINIEILFKNSFTHIIHKLISVFGMSIFLLCSVDFIVSVGLSTQVSLTNFRITLGSLLAKMDSKQDILAIGNVFSDPFYFPNLFIRHLQGISTAFIIVFTLIAIYKIANGFVKRLQ